MGPQPLAEDNLPKDDGDTSEDELPRIAGGTFVGGMGGDDVGTSDEESDERVEVGGYQLLNTDANARGDDESDDDDDEDDEDNVNGNAGWARFDDLPTDENSLADSEFDANWPGVGGVTTDSAALPHSSPPPVTDFLVGGGRVAEASETSLTSMDKVEDIRKAMTKITLPNTAVPEWASQLSDEDWRKALDERLNISKK